MSFYRRPYIFELEAKRDVEGLLGSLDYVDWVDTIRVVDALKRFGKMGNARAVDALIVIMKSKIGRESGYSREARWEAAEALGNIGKLSVEPLIQALKDENEVIRKTAARTLGKIGDKAAVPALTIALGDSSPDVRKDSAKALANMGVDEQVIRGAKRLRRVRCVRCGELETKSKATHIAGHGLICEKCDKELTQEILKDMGRLKMKRFCTKRNEQIEIKEIKGNLTCLPYGAEVECTEAGCKYSLAATLRVAVFGSAGLGVVDYTTELEKFPSKEPAKAIGPSKICDVCSKSVYHHDAYLFDTDTILASDVYIDFVIRGWVEKGLLPSSTISGGISDLTRTTARHDIKRQGGGTPWLVCKSCLPMFSVSEQDKAEAKKRADKFWK